MTFDELAELFAREAARRADAIAGFVPLGPAAFRVVVEAAPGRTHAVWVRRFEDGPSPMALLLAPAARVPKGRDLGADLARELLRRNATQPHAAWALAPLGDGESLALVRDLALEALAPERAVLHVIQLAIAADALEEEAIGGDDL